MVDMPVYQLCTYRGNLARCSPHLLSPASMDVSRYALMYMPLALTYMHYNLPELTGNYSQLLPNPNLILQTLYEVNTQITQVGHRVDTHMAHAQTHTLDISD